MQWEKIFAKYEINRGLISKIYKELTQINIKKNPNKLNRNNVPKENSTIEYIQMASRQMKICSILLIIRKMQIKTTMRYHLTVVRMTIIKKIYKHNKCWRGCGEKGTHLPCWWECKLIQPLWKTVWRFLKKLKIELSYNPAIPLLGIYPEKTIIQKDTCTPMFTAALFTLART